MRFFLFIFSIFFSKSSKKTYSRSFPTESSTTYFYNFKEIIQFSIELNHVKNISEPFVGEVKGGFKKRKGCLDKIFALRKVEEKVLEKETEMQHLCS